MRANIEAETVTIASSASLSSLAAGDGRVLVGIIMPASWDAADLTFKASNTGGADFLDVYEESSDTQLTVQAGASRHIRLRVNEWACFPYLKVQSGTTAVPVNQTAERVITLLFRREN